MGCLAISSVRKRTNQDWPGSAAGKSLPTRLAANASLWREKTQQENATESSVSGELGAAAVRALKSTWPVNPNNTDSIGLQFLGSLSSENRAEGDDEEHIAPTVVTALVEDGEGDDPHHNDHCADHQLRLHTASFAACEKR